MLSKTQLRDFPTSPANELVTHEYIHPSILKQRQRHEQLSEVAERYPEMIWKLLPLEEQVKKLWPFDEQAAAATSADNNKSGKKGASISELAMEILGETVQLVKKQV